MLWRSRTTLLLGALLAAAGIARPAQRPTLVDVTIDGSFADWTEVLANPLNAGRDGDGSTVPCFLSTDLDCAVDRPSHDLVRFAWTANATYLFLYAERMASSGVGDYLFVYLDLDRDGVMETTDKVLVVRMRSDSRNADADLRTYTPASPVGDSLADGAWLADGWTLPGGVSGGSGNVAPGAGNAPGGAVYETAIRWSRLGIPPGSAILYHASCAGGTSLPSEIEDNMGAASGGPGDTGWRGVRVTPSHVEGAAPDTILSLDHDVVNEGNLAARMDVQAVSGSGLDLSWRLDSDGDGTYETFLGFDSGGDGSFAAAGDLLTPDGDGDANGQLDVGVMAAAATARVRVDATVPVASGGLSDEIVVSAWHDVDPSTRVSVSDFLRVGDVTISRDETRTGVSSQPAWLPHVLENNLDSDAIVNLSPLSLRGWSWSFFADPTQDGDPADAAPLADSDRDGRPDMRLAPHEKASILARVVVPTSPPERRRRPSSARTSTVRRCAP